MTAIQNPALELHFGGVVKFEESLIGCILLDPNCLKSIAVEVSKFDFFDVELQQLFALMIDLHDAAKPIGDIRLLVAECRSHSLQIESSRLAEIFSDVTSSRHAEFYAQKVIEASRQRRLYGIANKIHREVENPSAQAAEIIGKITHDLETISNRSRNRCVSLQEIRNEFIADLESPESGATIYTGIFGLDQTIGGLRPGEMTIIAGRPGCGKSSLAWQVAEYSGRKGREALFVSLEMARSELFCRVAAGNAEIDSSRIRMADCDESDIDRLRTEAEELSKLPIHVFDPSAATITQIAAEARLQKSRIGLDVLLIDYVGLLRPCDLRQRRFEQVAEDSKAIKRLAKELQIPVVALCQLNREADGNLPKLSHLRDSGSIEQDADQVVLLHREKRHHDDRPDDIKIIVAKNRHGTTGSLTVKFDKQRTRFFEDHSWCP